MLGFKIKKMAESGDELLKTVPICDSVSSLKNWWKDDKYTKTKRWYAVRFMGKNLFKIPYHKTVYNSYFKFKKPRELAVKALLKLIDNGFIDTINSNSKVLEPGCNVGTNLLLLQDATGCSVTGIDISKHAVDIANKKIWKNRYKYSFSCDDVLTTGFFNNHKDNYFDLTFTHWHLIHVPYSKEKVYYINQLKRISKNLVFLEPVSEKEGVEIYCNGEYCLSWDKWERYGMIHINKKEIDCCFESPSTEIFIKKVHKNEKTP